MAAIPTTQNGLVTCPDAVENHLTFPPAVISPGQEGIAYIDLDTANASSAIQFSVNETINSSHAGRIGGTSIVLEFRADTEPIRFKGATGLKFAITVVTLPYQ